MNKTSYIILKLLSQHSLTSEEILKYIPINYLTLMNNIKSINIFLNDHSLPTIIKNNQEFVLRLTPSEKEKFYNSCTNYSQNQRCNYLILKLLINKKLNLDLEKDLLNISRSTIKRDFEKIKIYLNNNMIEVNSIKWQGIYLGKFNLRNIYSICCEILLKFYYEIDILPKLLKKYLAEISIYPYQIKIKNICEVFSFFNLKIGEMTLKYFLALDTCFYLFEDFQLDVIEDEYIVAEKKIDFIKIYNQIKNLNKFSIKYSKYIAICIWNILNMTFPKKKLYQPIVNDFENYFNLILTEKEKYFLSIQLYYSEFRKKNNIYTVKKYLQYQIDKKIIKLLDSFLIKHNIKIFYGDKLELLELIKTFFIKNEAKFKKNILIIKKEINQGNINYMKEVLSKIYINFNIEIENSTSLEINYKQLQHYDLILSDSITNLKMKYRIFKYNFELNSLIDEYLIEIFYKKLKQNL